MTIIFWPSYICHINVSNNRTFEKKVSSQSKLLLILKHFKNFEVLLHYQNLSKVKKSEPMYLKTIKLSTDATPFVLV